MKLLPILSTTFLLLLLLPVHAAEAPAVVPEPGAETVTEPATPAEPIVDNDEVAGDEEESTEEADQSSARFIPTEQISQDLGVSFPIDI